MAVPEGNGPISQTAYVMIRGINTLEDLRRVMWEAWNKVREEHGLKKPENQEDLRAKDQHEASLEQDARQPRLAMEADGPADTKTRERTEGAAKAVRALHGDSFSARRVDPGPKTNSTIFGVTAKPLDLSCRDDVLIENGDVSSKLCLPSLEMCSPSAAGGLLPTGEISRAKTTFNKSPLRLYSTEETSSKGANLWTSVPSAWYDSSFRKLLAVPSCRRVIETKSMQNRTFDPGGSQDRLRACAFLGMWRALLCGEVHVRAG